MQPYTCNTLPSEGQRGSVTSMDSSLHFTFKCVRICTVCVLVWLRWSLYKVHTEVHTLNLKNLLSTWGQQKRVLNKTRIFLSLSWYEFDISFVSDFLVTLSPAFSLFNFCFFGCHQLLREISASLAATCFTTFTIKLLTASVRCLVLSMLCVVSFLAENNCQLWFYKK